MKTKRVKLSTLQTKADKAMSQYIRQKYSVDGYVKCVSCGVIVFWQNSDCGHFISRRHFATRYVEENCHPECIACNRFSPDHMIGYTEYFIDTYGREKIDELRLLSKKTLSPSEKRAIVEKALDYYTAALEGLI
jgi:hypothetical protein